MTIELDREFEIPIYSPVCDLCVQRTAGHRERGRYCKAFPEGEGIPMEIWTGRNGHRQPWPGDRGIRFKSMWQEGKE